MRNLIGTLLLSIGMLLSASPVMADVAGPRDVVVQVIDSLKTSVREHDAKTDPQGDKLQGQLQKILEPVVDFGFIARVVMGDAAKSATPAQMKRFEDTFRTGMVATYAKGVSGYLDAEMNVLPLSPDAEGQNRVAVRQEVVTASGTQIVDYTMAKNRKTGEWKLINVVLNGINLGKTFRSQFAQSYKQYSGDLDKVIDHWGQAPQSGA